MISFTSFGLERRQPATTARFTAGLSAARGRHAFIRELLHPVAGLGDVDIALGVGRNVVARADDAGGLDFAHDAERLAVDDRNALVVPDIEELLFGVLRQGE